MSHDDTQAASLDDRREGRVIFRSSRELRVSVGDEVWVCELRGIHKKRKESAVVGDRVRVTPSGEGRGAIEEILPRKNFLSRRREVGGGRQLIVASNVDVVLAVFAVRQPRLKFGALDRLLVAAESHGLESMIVLNKTDLGPVDEVEEAIPVYESIGYRVLRTSVEASDGLNELGDELRGGVSVVSGPSGVGKSSLLSAVLGVEIRVGEVSRHNEKGRHTTTAATGYQIPGGGAVIDTPGFRDYGLWGMEPTEVARCMPDLAPYVADCRFSDCLHRGEPKCAVQSAADAGEIDARRIRSYRGILDSVIDQRASK